MRGSDPEKRDYVDSLRLSTREQEQLLSELDRASEDGKARDRRVAKRAIYHRQAGLIVQMRHFDGTVTNYLVRARNLSTTGIGFLHGGFVYVGTRCSIALMTIDNHVVKVEGEVTRCRLIRGHVHEVGVRFDEPIRMRDFVASHLLGEQNTAEASVELPQLGGSVLYVEDSISDQELLKFHLAKLGTRVYTVANGLAALDAASRNDFSAVITGVWLPVMSGIEVAQCLRESGYTKPIIALTADDRVETRADALRHGCTCVLAKPYRFDQLVSVLSEYMPRGAVVTPAEASLVSELWSDEQMRPLIRAYLSHLHTELEEIGKALDCGTRDLVLRKMCLDVKGSAGGYGYPQISVAAAELLKAEQEGGDIQQLKQRWSELCDLCRAAMRGAQIEPNQFANESREAA